jgi:site-specific DNA-methyltransferase (adenine-specific)
MKHTILTGDCLTHLPSIPDNTVDVIITSPPYNIGINYKTYNDQKPRDVYLNWLKTIGVELFRVLKNDGSFFLNVGSTNVDPWISMDVSNIFRDIFVLQNHITWVKSISIGDDTVGHFKPINSKRFLNQNHESIFHFSKTGNTILDRLAIGVSYKDKTNIKRRGHKQDKRCAGNNWFIPYETVQNKNEKYNHPAGFPLELPMRCLKLHGKSDLVVLDPFMGTGTTIVAAHKLGHIGIGIELDADYVNTCIARLR